ncbi:MAG: HAD family hydrolase [Bacteroidia bacterium]|jgi:putative hydrolase of the HAD superfamily
MTINSIIFDLDNTLYDENVYLELVFTEFFKKNNIDYDISSILTDKFRLKANDIFGEVLKDINEYSHKKQEALFELYKYINCKISLYDDAYDLISFLNIKNIKLGIITNGVIEAQKNKVKCLDLETKIDKIIYARSWGKEFEKPNPRPFAEALKLLKAKPSEVLYIGDNPKTDIMGAKAIGIKSVRYLNGYLKNIQCNDTHNIKRLIEIKKYIES